jgi:glycosyltransferase involved in cell wall biosynthesis
MIGIGITTRNRPEVLSLTLDRFARNTKKEDVKFVIVDDNSRATTAEMCKQAMQGFNLMHIYFKTHGGVANAKNSCLRELRDCSHVFLFDDDIFPIHENWITYYLAVHKVTGNNLLIHSKPMALQMARVMNETEFIYELNTGTGCLMSLTPEVINKVGAFNRNYSYYGNEHLGYCFRVVHAKLNRNGAFVTPKNTSKYLHSLDVDGWQPYNKILRKFESADAFAMRNLWVHQSIPTYNEEKTNTKNYYIPL